MLELLDRVKKEASKLVENLPTAEIRKQLTNERILSKLKSLGVASTKDVSQLESRVKDLEKRLDEALAPIRPKVSASVKTQKKATAATTAGVKKSPAPKSAANAASQKLGQKSTQKEETLLN